MRVYIHEIYMSTCRHYTAYTWCSITIFFTRASLTCTPTFPYRRNIHILELSKLVCDVDGVRILYLAILLTRTKTHICCDEEWNQNHENCITYWSVEGIKHLGIQEPVVWFVGRFVNCGRKLVFLQIYALHPPRRLSGAKTEPTEIDCRA